MPTTPTLFSLCLQAFGLVRAFGLLEIGQRAIEVACREALKTPRDEEHRKLLKTIQDMAAKEATR